MEKQYKQSNKTCPPLQILMRECDNKFKTAKEEWEGLSQTFLPGCRKFIDNKLYLDLESSSSFQAYTVTTKNILQLK